MSSPRLRWGVLGTARINRSLIPAIRASARSELTAVASRSPDHGSAYAAEWEIPRAYPSYDALLADAAIDVVYIPLPNHLHVEWTLRAIAAGKHVLCEKPLALMPADVDRVSEAASTRGVVVAEAFMYRHHPLTHRVAALVQVGTLGRLRVIRGAFTFTLTRADDVRLNPEWGGGSLWDVGCYPVSYARLLAGEPLVVTGQSTLGDSGIDVGFSGTLLFGDDVQGVFDCGFGAHFRTFMEIAGTDGVLTVETPFKPGVSSELRLIRGEQVERIEVAGEPLYLGEVQDIEGAVLDRRPPRVTLTDSRGNVAALAALQEAARSGCAVAVAAIG
jgi:D-xylose 1-dehydrogenase (NADP+, D-xylono-1,5-lactone-forming)